MLKTMPWTSKTLYQHWKSWTCAEVGIHLNWLALLFRWLSQPFIILQFFKKYMVELIMLSIFRSVLPIYRYLSILSIDLSHMVPHETSFAKHLSRGFVDLGLLDLRRFAFSAAQLALSVGQEGIELTGNAMLPEPWERPVFWTTSSLTHLLLGVLGVLDVWRNKSKAKTCCDRKTSTRYQQNTWQEQCHHQKKLETTTQTTTQTWLG